MNKIFVGYDSREDIAWQVCEHSICRFNTNIAVEPIIQKKLREDKLYWRDIDYKASTEFTFTRFLIPHLMHYKGWALFCDSDIVFLEDVQSLFDLADDKYAIMCVKHDYSPKATKKMDGQVQSTYPRKNWSSVVLWNCGHPSNSQLTLEVVNNQDLDGKYFHRFSWLKDNEIGSLPLDWNWLAGWSSVHPETDTSGSPDSKPRAIHYTEGGPWFKEYRNCEFHLEWKRALFEMLDS
jgi:lipopolysaccharide biosynthesis glycosyltransferase